MSPDQFLSQIRQRPAPAYLFLGPEHYYRDQCRRALLDRVLPDPAEWEEGLVRHDLEEQTLGSVVDDARSFSLFAPRRVIWISRAEGVLPKVRAAAAEEVEDDAEPVKKKGGGTEILAAYLKDPTPDTVLVFDCARFEFDSEDKAKVERVRKFYAAVPNVVEFPRLQAAPLRQVAQSLAKEHKLRIGADELGLIVEAVGGSASRIAAEMEKLRLLVGEGGTVTGEQIAAMVPQAQATTIFALVAAMGRRDRTKSLELLDVLIRGGEYLPLALQFLATQFRQALVSKEGNLRSPSQIMGYFSKMGVAMWPSRADQIAQTATAFSTDQLRTALRQIAKADSTLKDIRPDERIVMEEFVLTLTR